MFKKFLLLSLLPLFGFLADRLLKIWFLKNPEYSRDFIVSVLRFHLETNRGIAFGISFNQAVLLILVAVALFFLFHFLIKAYLGNDSLSAFFITLIIFGAFSNLFDRLRYGYVIDYIDVPFFTVFNLADVMITGGAVLLLFKNFLNKKPS